MLKPLLKKLLNTVAPQTTAAIMAARARAHSQLLFKQWGVIELNQKLMQSIGTRVLAGPFIGMQLTPLTHQENIGPYLLGTYEHELNPFWRHVLTQSFSQIIDVGAKIGYYAIGLARLFPQTPVFAFDTDWWARKAITEMAAANGATNITIAGFCDPSWLQRNLRCNALIVSDCEGYERELLCRQEIPALATASMVIEMHEHWNPGETADILSRFAKTHIAQRTDSNPRSETSTLGCQALNAAELQKIAGENRAVTSWYYLTPK